jgi:hypothetical protein
MGENDFGSPDISIAAAMQRISHHITFSDPFATWYSSCISDLLGKDRSRGIMLASNMLSTE